MEKYQEGRWQQNICFMSDYIKVWQKQMLRQGILQVPDRMLTARRM